MRINNGQSSQLRKPYHDHCQDGSASNKDEINQPRDRSRHSYQFGQPNPDLFWGEGGDNHSNLYELLDISKQDKVEVANYYGKLDVDGFLD